MRDLVRAQIGGADFRHHDERTAEDLRRRQADEDVAGIAVDVAADARLGQLGEANGKIDVGARKVDFPRPAVVIAIRAVTEDDAAELERAVEILGGGHAQVGEGATAAQLRFRGDGGNRDTGGEQHDPAKARRSHGAIFSPFLTRRPGVWLPSRQWVMA